MDSKAKNNIRFVETETRSRDKIVNIEVDLDKWNGLKEMIQEYSVSYNWWLTFAIAFFSSSLTIGLTYINLIGSNNPFMDVLAIIFYVTLAVGGVLLLFYFVHKKITKNAKHKILREMSRMEPKDSENENFLSEKMPTWVAKKQKNVHKGVEYRRQTLSNKSLKYLSFRVSSNSKYWRAGLKLDLPENEEMPNLITPDSFLFHVGSEKGKSLIYIYENGNPNPVMNDHLNIEKLNPYNPIELKFIIDDKNIINCYVNDRIIHNAELDPNLYKKFYLAAWGDKEYYEVEFNEVEFRAE